MLSMSSTVPKRQEAVNGPDAPAGAAAALSELVVLVFRLDGLLKAVGDALAEPTGQTTARWRVLAAIDEAPLTVAQIARAWWLTRQSVQRIADLLARDGLVAFQTNPAHRRAQLVALTPSGRRALDRIRAAQHAWASELGDRVDLADVHAANQALTKVIAHLDEVEHTARQRPRNAP
jgi:DNA-binding MarR family transcriptional regulator